MKNPRLQKTKIESNELCKKDFDKEWRLKSHIYLVHDGLACHKCGKYFRSKKYLKIQKVIIHEGIKNYKCSHYNKSFTVKIHLNSQSHVERHIDNVHEVQKSLNSKKY